MYKIYIKNFISANDPGTLDYSEALFDTSEYQYDEFDRTVIEPVVKEGLNKSGSLEFTVTPQNPFYDRIRIIKTIFIVWIDDVMVFRGRTISMTDDIYRQRKIFCEGELAYLNDSLQPPIKESTLGPADYFSSMIVDHNSQMNLFSSRIAAGEDRKLFTPGNVTVSEKGLSYRRISGSGEIVITDENGDYTISGSDEIIAQFSWAIGKINTSTGENSNNDEDNGKFIRSVSQVSVKSGSLVKAGGGYRCGVVMYSGNTVSYSGPFTGMYEIRNDCDIRIFFQRDDEDADDFSVADLATAPGEALILSGLSTVTIVQKFGDVAMTPFNSTSYRNTLDAIESDLLEVYGGYISVRYDGNTRYIDYTSDPPHSNENQRVISFGVNLQEVTKEINGEDVYSILLPTGESNLLMEQSGSHKMITNTTSIYAFPENAIETYGPIFKTQAFSGISKRDELANYAGNYIDKTYHGAAATYTIKAVDMHFVDESHPLIRAGSKCRITLWPSQIIQNRTCTEATFELQAPENNEYVFENISDERNSLTTKYKKQTKSSGRSNYGVSTSPTTEDKGAGDEDTIIRSNGNIILYPGAEKMVSIPLAKTFLAPSLTEWSLGPIKYKTKSGLKIGDGAEIDQNLMVKGKASIGSSVDVFSQMGTGTSLFVNGGIHGKNIRGSTLIVGSTGLGNDGQFRIMRSDSTPGANIYMPVQLQMTGGKDSNNQDVVLASMWVLGDHDVNFNIADTKWFKDQIVAAHNEIDVAEYTWDIHRNDQDQTDNDVQFSVSLKDVKLGFRTGVHGPDDDPVYEITKTYNIGPQYIDLRLFKNNTWDYDENNDAYKLSFGIRTKGDSGSGYTVTLVTDTVGLPALKAVFADHASQSSSWWKTTGTNANKFVIPAYTANVYLSADTGNEHPLLNSNASTGDIILDPNLTVDDVSVSSSFAADENGYQGALGISKSSGGNVRVYNNAVSDISAEITGGTSIALLLNIPTCSLTLTGSNNPQWSSTYHTYTFNVSSSLSIDGTRSLTRTSPNKTLDPVDAINYGKNAVKVVKGSWSGKSIEFTTDAPNPPSDAPKKLTLSWNIGSTWNYDNGPDNYQLPVQIKDSAYVIDAVYIDLPALKAVFADHASQSSSWWKTTGTNANKFVIPAYTANVYLSADTRNEHPLLGNSISTGNIVLDPNLSVDDVSLSSDFSAEGNGYQGTLGVSKSSGGNVRVYNNSVSGISAGITGNTSIALLLNIPTCSLTLTGSNNPQWSSTYHTYTFNVSSSMSVDGTRSLTRTSANKTLDPVDAIQYGETLVYPTNVVISDSVSSSGRRISDATVYYKGPDTSGSVRTISGVDVTDIYNDGKSSGTSTSSYYVPFTVTFSDGHTGTYLSNCANVWNQGAADAAPPEDTLYTYHPRGEYINVRSSASSSASAIVGQIKPNTDVTFIRYSSGYTYTYVHIGYSSTNHPAGNYWIHSDYLAYSPGPSQYDDIGWVDDGGGDDPQPTSVYIKGVYSSGYSGAGQVIVTYANGSHEIFNVYYSYDQVKSMSGHDGSVANSKASSAVVNMAHSGWQGLKGRIAYAVYTDGTTTQLVIP